MKIACVALFIICAALSFKVYAGDLYVCKQSNGVKAYQDHPCDHTETTIGKSHIRTDPYTPPPPSTHAIAPGDVQLQKMRETVQYDSSSPRNYTSGSQPAPIVAYLCTAGRRTWIQSTPCPASYAHSVPTHVEGTIPAGQYIEGINNQGQYVQGYTVAPQHVDGAGYAEQQAPVRQQALDRDAVCKRLADHNIKLKHSGSSDVYERNLARAKYCAH